jgi:hypothetical protein
LGHLTSQGAWTGFQVKFQENHIVAATFFFLKHGGDVFSVEPNG